jgi:hypothetical protein
MGKRPRMLLQQTRKLVRFRTGELAGGSVQQLEENPPLLNTAKGVSYHSSLIRAALYDFWWLPESQSSAARSLPHFHEIRFCMFTINADYLEQRL